MYKNDIFFVLYRPLDWNMLKWLMETKDFTLNQWKIMVIYTYTEG